MASYTHLRLSDKVANLLDDATNKARALAALPSDGTAAALEDPAFSTRVLAAIAALVEAEGRFTAGGAHDAILVREATRQLLAVMDFDATAALMTLSTRVALRSSGGIGHFVEAITSFRNIAKERLATGVDVLRASDERASKLAAKTANAESELRAKRELLRLRRDERDLEAAAIADQITRLKAEIEDVSAKGKSNEGALTAFSTQQEASQRGAHGSKIAELRDELVRLTADFAKTVDNNETTASTLRKRRNHIRSEYARVVAEYDRDMLEVTEKIAKIKELIAREKSQLDILRPHFALVDTNARAAAEEAEVVRKRREAERAAFEAKHGPPVRRIQRWYRRILHTRAAAKKAKKGKGKSKKAKK